jgi:glycerol-3-phosphate acyltransferase PlsY
VRPCPGVIFGPMLVWVDRQEIAKKRTGGKSGGTNVLRTYGVDRNAGYSVLFCLR